jgi:hypothetical protein
LCRLTKHNELFAKLDELLQSSRWSCYFKTLEIMSLMTTFERAVFKKKQFCDGAKVVKQQ